eukprot:scaffold78503_cov63-Phaeocystis_antarctica.AAC.1
MARQAVALSDLGHTSTHTHIPQPTSELRHHLFGCAPRREVIDEYLTRPPSDALNTSSIFPMPGQCGPRAGWPRLTDAWGGLRRDLALKAASSKPALACFRHRSRPGAGRGGWGRASGRAMPGWRARESCPS